jgi:hypothetical protein
MQPKRTSVGKRETGPIPVPASNPPERGSPAASRRRWTRAIVPLAAVLVLGSATELLARALRAPPAAVAAEPRLQLGAPDPAFVHVADADRDVGPGEAESALAQHPGAGGR